MVVGLAIGTLVILGTFLILSGAFIGVGLLIRRGFGCKATDIDHYFLAFWTGFSLVLLFLIVWNFFMPVGLVSLITVLVLGGLGWWLEGIPARPGTDDWRPSVFQVVLFLIASLWVANQATAALSSWDDGLYHLQGVKWAETYPVVPGIANLLGPLGFNNASFLYDAMLDSGLWKDRGFHIANGVLVFVMVLQASVAGARFASGRSHAASSRLYRFLLLAPSISLARNNGLVSYSSDVPSGLILLAAAGLMYEVFDSDAAQQGTAEDVYRLVSLAILLAAAVCIKMTSAIFAAVAMPTVLFFWWRRRVRSGRITSTFIAIAVITVTFALPWLARGVVMSGYPLFPLSFAGFPVAWRAPLEHVQAEYAYIGFTEREFTWRFIGRNWVRQVFLADIYSILVPALLVGFVILALIFSKALRNELRKAPGNAWWILLPTLVSIVAWLLSAPSTRYSRVLFWIVAATVLCQYLLVLWPRLGKVAKQRVVSAVVLLGISSPFVEPSLAAIMRGDNPVVATLKYNVISPEPGQWLRAIRRPPEVTGYTTRYDLVLNVPRKPQGVEVFVKCWNAALPCTPTPAPNLRLIEPGRLEKGFIVEGGWEMEDWPSYWQHEFLREWRARRKGTDAAR